jgi:hypothetical protein
LNAGIIDLNAETWGSTRMRRFILAIALTVATAGAGAAATFEWQSLDPAITIGDSSFPPTKATPFGTGYPFKLPVRGCSGMTAITVRFGGFTHTNPDDVNIMLVSPGASPRRTILMEHCGGSNALSNIGFTLDDAAGSALPDSLPISNFGTYRPAKYGLSVSFPAPAGSTTNNTLAAVVDPSADPNGDWLLFVCDDNNNGKTGSLAKWYLDITEPGPPANDTFASAQVLTGALPISLGGTCFGGTAESGEPTHADYDTPDFSVWYQWTAPSSGEVVAETSTVTFNTVLGVYTGSAVNALTEVAFNNDAPGNVNHESGLIFTATAGTTYFLKVDAYDGYSVGTFTLNLHVPTAAPTIAATASDSSLMGAAFTHDILAMNYPSAYTATGLPPGLTLDTQYGVISGTPTVAGVYTVAVHVSNSLGAANQTLTLTIHAPPVITSPLYASCVQGAPFSYAIIASNTPTSYAIDPGTSDQLPTGITLDTSTGVISGTTTDPTGALYVDIAAINADGEDVETLTLYVNGPTAPTVTSPTIGHGRVGVKFLFAVAGTNSPDTYDAIGLPPGLDIGDDSTRPYLISGTPTDAGTYPVAVTVENAAGTTVQQLELVIAPADPGADSSPDSHRCGVGPLALLAPLALIGWLRRRRV